MIAIIRETFEPDIANNITRFLEHPTAPMIKRLKEYTDLLSFDNMHDWHKWQTVYGFQRIQGSRRAYLTYGGGPEGGVVRLTNSTMGKAWYVWHRNWGLTANFVRIPRELTLVTRNEDGYEAIKLVMDGYELGENECYLDDLEDAAEENEPSEAPADEEDESDVGTDTEPEEEDDEEDLATALNNERREELEALNEQLQSYNDLLRNDSTVSGIMTMNMMINQTEERIRELNHQ